MVQVTCVESCAVFINSIKESFGGVLSFVALDFFLVAKRKNGKHEM